MSVRAQTALSNTAPLTPTQTDSVTMPISAISTGSEPLGLLQRDGDRQRRGHRGEQEESRAQSIRRTTTTISHRPGSSRRRTAVHTPRPRGARARPPARPFDRQQQLGQNSRPFPEENRIDSTPKKSELNPGPPEYGMIVRAKTDSVAAGERAAAPNPPLEYDEHHRGDRGQVPEAPGLSNVPHRDEEQADERGRRS